MKDFVYDFVCVFDAREYNDVGYKKELYKCFLDIDSDGDNTFVTYTDNSLITKSCGDLPVISVEEYENQINLSLQDIAAMVKQGKLHPRALDIALALIL